MSGPLLDRIDLHVEVPRPATALLRQKHADGESSSVIRARVSHAWKTHVDRQGKSNARLLGADFDRFCRTSDDGWLLLERAADRFNLSARALQRVLRVVRTIADLAGTKEIRPPNVTGALSLRCLDRPAG